MKALRFLSILFIALISLNSCTKYSFMSMNDKLVGKWVVEDATSRADWSFQEKDMTNNFRYFAFEFVNDGTVLSTISSSNASYRGGWSMEERYYYVDDVRHTEYILRWSGLMPNGTPPRVVDMEWTVDNIDGKYLRATERYNNATWTYKLRRQ